MERAVAAFGDIDVLVANAGVSMHARFDEIEDFSTFERLFRINAMGTVWCVRHAYPSLKRTRGLVVGVSSLAGKTGVPGRTTYCTSKFAQSGFLEAFRIEAEDHGVAVMAAFPGVVKTEIRRHGWNGRGETAGVSGLAEEDAMPVEECARLIVDGMRRRRREVVMTREGARRAVAEADRAVEGRRDGARRARAQRATSTALRTRCLPTSSSPPTASPCFA